MNIISIFTDGSSRGNPGPGGWGSVVVDGNTVIELGGGEKHTTNNRMELSAAIYGLQKASEAFGKVRNDAENTSVKIFSDSSYVINGITKWVHGWKRNGWKTKTKDDVVNVDLWQKLDDAVAQIGTKNISWEYVGGHIGVAGNERCDEIATGYADGDEVKLYEGTLSGYSIPNILDVSHDETLLKAKKSSSSKSKSSAKAYSYVSSVGGKIEIHHTWAECEKRVKGAKGARFKKSFSPENEKEVIDEFGALLF
ncbi:MAG: ribonuclease HI [Candidatus Pacebacteria bacterium]|nr:ribonuclease HI [Candidatus Paceibacterota bacterium]